MLDLVRFQVNLVYPTLARYIVAMTDTIVAIELGVDE